MNAHAGVESRKLTGMLDELPHDPDPERRLASAAASNEDALLPRSLASLDPEQLATLRATLTELAAL